MKNPKILYFLLVLIFLSEVYFTSNIHAQRKIQPKKTISKVSDTPKVGSVRRSLIGMELVYIPPGEFMMGSSGVEIKKAFNDCIKKKGSGWCSYDTYSAEAPKHKVTIKEGFWMGKFEVTLAQWEAVMGKTNSISSDCGRNCPIVVISWDDIQEFLKKLNSRDTKFEYSLPTEAEWEFAARAGTTTTFAFGNNLNQYQANFDGDGPRTKGTFGPGALLPVGSYKPNRWGLYDMHGNVSEWTQDIYKPNYQGLPTDGSANLSIGDPELRVLRGGTFQSESYYCRSAARSYQGSGQADFATGFRLVAREKYPRRTEPMNKNGSLKITGYVDVIEAVGNSCRIRIITQDKVYSGLISLSRLSELTKQKINSYQDAVSMLDGRQIVVVLLNPKKTINHTSNINFGNISQIIFPRNRVAKQPTWSERNTDTEKIIDLSTDILFDFDRYEVKPGAVPVLLKLARLIRESKAGVIQLNGFTDSVGSSEYNLRLSEQRAASVKNWLVKKGNINAEGIQTKGFGENQPSASNTNADGSDNPFGRQKNRRVEIRIPRNQ